MTMYTWRLPRSLSKPQLPSSTLDRCRCVSHSALKSNSTKTKPMLFQDQNSSLWSYTPPTPLSQRTHCSHPALATSLSSPAILGWCSPSCPPYPTWEGCLLECTSLPWTISYASLASGTLIPVQDFLCSSARRIFLRNKFGHYDTPTPEKSSGLPPPACRRDPKSHHWQTPFNLTYGIMLTSSACWPPATLPQFSMA